MEPLTFRRLHPRWQRGAVQPSAQLPIPSWNDTVSMYLHTYQEKRKCIPSLFYLRKCGLLTGRPVSGKYLPHRRPLKPVCVVESSGIAPVSSPAEIFRDSAHRLLTNGHCLLAGFSWWVHTRVNILTDSICTTAGQTFNVYHIDFQNMPEEFCSCWWTRPLKWDTWLQWNKDEAWW